MFQIARFRLNGNPEWTVKGKRADEVKTRGAFQKRLLEALSATMYNPSRDVRANVIRRGKYFHSGPMDQYAVFTSATFLRRGRPATADIHLAVVEALFSSREFVAGFYCPPKFNNNAGVSVHVWKIEHAGQAIVAASQSWLAITKE